MVPLIIYVDHSSNGQFICPKAFAYGDQFFLFFYFFDIDFFMCHAQEADIDILGNWRAILGYQHAVYSDWKWRLGEYDKTKQTVLKRI